MKKADNPVVVVRDNSGDVTINVTINNGASPIPASVMIALIALMAIIVLAVAHFCPDKFAKIVDTVCSYFSKHIGG